MLKNQFLNQSNVDLEEENVSKDKEDKNDEGKGKTVKELTLLS